MSQTYYAILTAIGEAKLANAAALGTTLQLTQMAVGDGSGATPQPSRTQTALVKENRRGPLNSLFVDPANPSQIVAEHIIPEDVGGWWIREIGLYDAAGDLCAVANCPDTYKPVLASGSGRIQTIRMVLIVSNTSAVQLKIDPSIVLAPRGYVDQSIEEHLDASNPHPQYATLYEVERQIDGVDSRLSKKLPLAGGDMLGDIGLRGARERVTALGNVAGEVTIDTTAGGTFTATATGSVNWVFSGRPLAGQCRYFELRLANGGAFTQTFPDGCVFSGGDRSLTVAGVDKLIVMLTATGADVSIIRGMA